MNKKEAEGAKELITLLEEVITRYEVLRPRSYIIEEIEKLITKIKRDLDFVVHFEIQ
jgi:DNA polymerase sigma